CLLHQGQICLDDIHRNQVENNVLLQAQISILQLVVLFDPPPSVCQVCEILLTSLESVLPVLVVENMCRMTFDSITYTYCLLSSAQTLLTIDDQHQPLQHLLSHVQMRQQISVSVYQMVLSF